MKRSKFTEAQMASILRQVEEGTSVEEVCRKAGISIQTFYRGRKKYCGLMPQEMKHLKQLKDDLLSRTECPLRVIPRRSAPDELCVLPRVFRPTNEKALPAASGQNRSFSVSLVRVTARPNELLLVD